MAAALAQVAEGGYSSAAVQPIARRAGVAVGTLYRHFPSKSRLFAEVFRRTAQRELDVVAEVAGLRHEAGLDAGHPTRSAAERVVAAVEAFCRRALAGPVLAYAQIAEPVDPAVEAERLTLRKGYRDVFASVLEDGVAAGELRPHDSQTLAAALVGALGEALVGPLSPASRSEGRGHHEALVATLVQFCWDALPKKADDRAPARALA